MAKTKTKTVTKYVDRPVYSQPDTLTSYTDTAEKLYAPVKQKAEKDMTARFANQGILSSSAAQGGIANAVQGVDAQARQYATDQWKWDVARRDALQQQNTQNAMNLYNLLASGALGQMAYKKRVSYPNQFDIFKQVSQPAVIPPAQSWGPTGDPTENWTWLAPKKSEGPTGDPIYTVPMHTEEAYSRQSANNAAQSALQAQQDAALMERQKQAQAWTVANTPAAANANPLWDTIANDIRTNYDRMNSSDPTVRASALAPSKLLAMWRGMGMDVLGLAQNGDSHAAEVMASIYPNTYKDIIGGKYQPGQATAAEFGGAPQATGTWGTAFPTHTPTVPLTAAMPQTKGQRLTDYAGRAALLGGGSTALGNMIPGAQAVSPAVQSFPLVLKASEAIKSWWNSR